MTEITPELILTTLMKRPALLMQVKALVNSALVSGPWESFNASQHAKTRKTGYGPDASVRFTPEPYTFAALTTPDRVVVLVHRSSKPQQPIDWDNSWDPEEEEEAKAEYLADMAKWEKTPWRWTIQPHDGHDQMKGYAESREAAKIAADVALRVLGWVLVGNSYDPEPVQEVPG